MVNLVGLPPEVNIDPLGDLMLNFLIEKDSETEFIDLKATINIAHDAPFAKIAKDIFAFSNYGGGWIFVGFKEKTGEEASTNRQFIQIGLPDDFHIDQASLQEKFNAYSDMPIAIQYREFFRNIDGNTQKFAVIYIPGSTSILKPTKDGEYFTEEKCKYAFRTGEILIRRGTQSIPASDEEIEFIKRRAKIEGYSLSVLSGQPDKIQEVLYSNLFEVTKLPESVWSADLAVSYELPKAARDINYILSNKQLITFVNLTTYNGSLRTFINLNTIHNEPTIRGLSEENKQRKVIALLNKEIATHCHKLGLLHEPNKNKFYFPCDADNREEQWKPRFRISSTRLVAKKIWAEQLKRYIYWHIAVNARFTVVSDKIYLILSPSIQITNEGKTATFGEREGPIITRLMYNKYNSDYLNSLLFWAYKLTDGKEKINLLGGNIEVSSKPSEANSGIGILFDRPVSERLQEIPKIEIEVKENNGTI